MWFFWLGVYTLRPRMPVTTRKIMILGKALGSRAKPSFCHYWEGGQPKEKEKSIRGIFGHLIKIAAAVSKRCFFLRCLHVLCEHHMGITESIQQADSMKRSKRPLLVVLPIETRILHVILATSGEGKFQALPTSTTAGYITGKRL